MNFLSAFRGAKLACVLLPVALAGCASTQTITGMDGSSQTFNTTVQGAGLGCAVGAGFTWLADPATGFMTLVQNCGIGAAIGGAAGFVFGQSASPPAQTTNVNVGVAGPAPVVQDDSLYLNNGAIRTARGELIIHDQDGNEWITPAMRGAPQTCMYKDKYRGYIWSMRDLSQCPQG